MTQASLNKRAERYLARLDKKLRGLSAAERRDIVDETRSHFLEKLASGGATAVAEAMTAMGAPDEYGRRFVDEGEISEGPATTPRGWRLTLTLVEALFAGLDWRKVRALEVRRPAAAE